MRRRPPPPKRLAPDPAGILLIDKPEGMTSHDVVDAVRRTFGYGKVGHAGTLDPMATGVLVLLIGKATREQGRFLNDDKGYVGTLAFGAATTTHDRDGEVTDRSDPPPTIPRAAIEAVLPRFTGPIEQVPPMVSAIKHKGRPLYRYARQGVEVEREPRKVTIHALDLLEVDGLSVRFAVHCSKGTYIRTLAHDLGRALGTHAHLTALRRTRSGPFVDADCHALDEVLKSRPAELPYLLKLVSEIPSKPEPPTEGEADAVAAAASTPTPREEETP